MIQTTTPRNLPSVNIVLQSEEGAALIEKHGCSLVTYAVRQTMDSLRNKINVDKKPVDIALDSIVRLTKKLVDSIAVPSLKPVINATGIVLHTNLGRAPMGEAVLAEIAPIITGYSNLEFDLETAARGHRGDHIASLLRYLTGAEGVSVVNNNAAAPILALNTLAKGKEVIISRGELIEIGGAFRIPDIMKAAGVKMVEVGTTNRTRLSDYEAAIGPKTAMIVKAHKSNYALSGFTEEVSVAGLAGLAKKNGIVFMYDIGSGLLRKPASMKSSDEPDAMTSIRDGADLVTFSCDKLLGGPQAGVVAGRVDLVKRLAQAPLMRALRVGKLTLAALAAACRHYLDDATLAAHNPLFFFMNRADTDRKTIAHMLQNALRAQNVESEIIESTAQAGGGTLPDTTFQSVAVALIPPAGLSSKKRENHAEKVHHGLLSGDHSVLSILREGTVVFDVFALLEKDIPVIALKTAAIVKRPL